ncbi:MAG TPA: S41 family peptidase, partial [Bacteroidales bacterium]|nr:S41 family peptidase [Bacteroidales bacterium]
PSEKAGLIAGDRIVSIDGVEATGRHVDNEFVFKHLRGPKGSKVRVGILRKGRSNPTEYTLIRDNIPITSLDAAFMAAPAIGYIKLNRFAQNTMAEYQDAVRQLKREGLQKIILDLRGNSGGYLFAAVELADQFLAPGRLIVYTEGINSPRQEMEATWLGSFEKGEVCVLIDEGSASASEIVAGAVQDWDRGVVIGRRSFGKGLVQKQFPLTDGSAIRLTTARYFTPSGRCIQKPYEAGSDEYMMELVSRYEHGEYVNADSIQFPDSLKYSTRGGRTVYGGGGIMPDLFIPWDSTAYTELYADLAGEGLMNDLVLAYTEQHRKELLSHHPDIGAYIQGFQAPHSWIDELKAMAEENGHPVDPAELGRSSELILLQLKALVARNLFDVSAYFQVILKTDPAMLKAVEVLSDSRMQREILGK